MKYLNLQRPLLPTFNNLHIHNQVWTLLTITCKPAYYTQQHRFNNAIQNKIEKLYETT